MKIRLNTFWEIYNMNQILIYYSNAEKLRLQKMRFNKIKKLNKENKENIRKNIYEYK
tara:strand:+ start:15712 stop:15882 length:171 start_codon:yes stop_codon:yes gene_type:complete